MKHSINAYKSIIGKFIGRRLDNLKESYDGFVYKTQSGEDDYVIMGYEAATILNEHDSFMIDYEDIPKLVDALQRICDLKETNDSK